MRAGRLAAAVLLGIGFLVVSPSAAHACSCAIEGPTANERFAQSNVVFIGEPTSVRSVGVSPSGHRIYRFDVDLMQKGLDRQTIDVWTSDNGGTCGQQFRLGRQYQVHGFRQDNHFSTGLCSGNIEVASNGYAVIDGFGRFRALNAAVSAAGYRAAAAPGATGKWVGLAGNPAGDGWWAVNDAGTVAPIEDAPFLGDLGGINLTAQIAGLASTPRGRGYWLVGRDGGVFAFGDAKFLGSMGGLHLNAPIVGIASTPTGNGYWLAASDGGVFAFGDARFRGSAGALPLRSPVMGIAATPSDRGGRAATAGDGYWLVAADGGVFTYGDARFFGSAVGLPLAAPIMAIDSTPGGRGYWLLGADGGIFSFGGARYFGRPSPTDRPFVAIVSYPGFN